MTTVEQIRKALAAHAYWKLRLRDALTVGRYHMTPEQVQLDNLCDFGRWLHGSELSAAIKSSPIYRCVRDLHVQFHKEAAKVVQRLASGQTQKARESLEVGAYARASAALTEALHKWRTSCG